MTEIHIAAAVIDDGAGRILVVRKAGTSRFMLPGGKIEPAETPMDALRRELAEELGLVSQIHTTALGRFEAQAANEPGCTVVAQLFQFSHAFDAQPAAEIAEAKWVDMRQAKQLPLAPLLLAHVLPLIESLGLIS